MAQGKTGEGRRDGGRGRGRAGMGAFVCRKLGIQDTELVGPRYGYVGIFPDTSGARRRHSHFSREQVKKRKKKNTTWIILVK